MNKIFILTRALLVLLFVSCQQTGDGQEQTTSSPQATVATKVKEPPAVLIGKTLVIDYGTMLSEVRYQTDSLYWRKLNSEGQTASWGREVPSYETFGDGRFFVTWQQADGTTVTQIVDLREHKVLASISVVDSMLAVDSARMPLVLIGAAAVAAEEPPHPGEPRLRQQVQAPGTVSKSSNPIVPPSVASKHVHLALLPRHSAQRSPHTRSFISVLHFWHIRLIAS